MRGGRDEVNPDNGGEWKQMTNPALTIGMACYDDFDGVWFSIMALRVFHHEVMSDVELLVIDNNPSSAHGELVRKYIENSVGNGKYVPYTASTGTAAPRNAVFEYATSDCVLCIDSHVFLFPDSIRRLIEYFEYNPTSFDLLQGPLVDDNLTSYSSHLEDEWRDQMWGTWGTDRRAEFQREVTATTDTKTRERNVRVTIQEGPPFEIGAQGLGVFACRKAAWAQFSNHFSGFGGEEYYIHEKVRGLGRKTLCLPFLRWVHRFDRPNGVPYPLAVESRFRNYLFGLRELKMSEQRAVEHFSQFLSAETIDRITNEVDAVLGNES